MRGPAVLSEVRGRWYRVFGPNGAQYVRLTDRQVVELEQGGWTVKPAPSPMTAGEVRGG